MGDPCSDIQKTASLPSKTGRKRECDRQPKRSDTEITVNYIHFKGKETSTIFYTYLKYLIYSSYEYLSTKIECMFLNRPACGDGQIVSYLKPHEERVRKLAESLGIKGREKINLILDILAQCDQRIQDANHKFIYLVMAIMFVESRGDFNAVSSAGAIGIVQIKPRTAVAILLKLDPYTLFRLGLSPMDPLFIQINKVKELDNRSRRAITKQEHQRTVEAYKKALSKAIEMVTPRLFDKAFNLALGSLYLAYLVEKNKRNKGRKNVSEETLRDAIYSYHIGEPRVEWIKQRHQRAPKTRIKWEEAQKYHEKVKVAMNLLATNPNEFDRQLKR